jgi:hypothetical protein
VCFFSKAHHQQNPQNPNPLKPLTITNIPNSANMSITRSPFSHANLINPISNFPSFPNSAVRPSSFDASSSTLIRLGLSSNASGFFNKSDWSSNPNCGFIRRRSRFASIRAAGTDYYSTLDVGRSATLQEIKSAYRKLARKVCDCYAVYFLTFEADFYIGSV